MKKSLLPYYFLLLCSASNFPVFGQLSLSDHSAPYLQNFDDLGSTLPEGWTLRTDADETNLGNPFGFSTSQVNWATTSGNFRNVAGIEGLDASSSPTDQGNSLNRALGLRQTGSFGDPGAAFVFSLENTRCLTNFSFSFDFLLLSAQGRNTIWTLDYGIGENPNEFTSLMQIDPASDEVLAGEWGSFQVSLDPNDLAAIENRSEPVHLRLVALSSSTGGGSRDTYGIDNVELHWISEEVCTYLDGDLSNSALGFGFQAKGTISDPKFFSVTPVGFEEEIELEITGDFEISGSDLVFGQNLTLNPTEEDQEIYLRFSPQESSPVNTVGILSLNSGDVSLAYLLTGITSLPLDYQDDFTECPPRAWQVINLANSNTWECQTVDDNTFKEVSAFGGGSAAEDWFISPAMEKDGLNDVLFSFSSWFRFQDSGFDQALKVYYSVAHNPNTGTVDPSQWIEITDQFDFPTEEQSWTNSGNTLISLEDESFLFIAFQYQSSGEESGSSSQWRINDVFIRETGGTELSLNAPDEALDFGPVLAGEVSDTLYFSIIGQNFIDDIVVFADPPFEVSLDGLNFSDELLINPDEPSPIEIKVIFKPSLADGAQYEEQILVFTAGVPGRSLQVKGKEASLFPLATPYQENFNQCPDSPDQWTIFNRTNGNAWNCSNNANGRSGSSGDFSLEVNGFGGSGPADTWAISPALEFSVEDAFHLEFYSQRRFNDAAFEPALSVMVSGDYPGFGDPMESNWVTFEEALFPENSGSNFSNWTFSGDLLLDMDQDTVLFFAFRYQSSGTSGSTSSLWRMDDFRITNQRIQPDLKTLNFGEVNAGDSSELFPLSFTGFAINEAVNLSISGPFEIELEEGVFGGQKQLDHEELLDGKEIKLRFRPDLGITGVRTGIVSIDGFPGASVNLTGIEIGIEETVPYVENFDSPTVLSSGGWINFNAEGNQNWEYWTEQSLNGPGAIRMNGFPSSFNRNENWLISPAIDASQADFPVLQFFSYRRFSGGEIQLLISNDYDGLGDPRDFTWTQVEGFFPSITSQWRFSSAISLKRFANQSFHLAFLYVSGPAPDFAAAEWIIDELVINNAEEDPGVPSAIFVDKGPLHDFHFGFVAPGEISPSKEIQLSVQGIYQASLIAPDGFKLSLDNETFAQEIELDSLELLRSQKVYFRYEPSSPIAYGGALQFKSHSLSKPLAYTNGFSKEAVESFKVASWNIEWFGDTENGPSDVNLQLENVKVILESLDADVIALQEITDLNKFYELVASLEGYKGFHSTATSRGSEFFDESQKLCFLYKTDRVDSLAARPLLAEVDPSSLVDYPGGDPERFWASGRLPFFFEVMAKIGDWEERIYLVNVHARSNGGGESSGNPRYAMRRYDVELLKDSLDTYFNDAPLILLGDYNDDLDETVAPQSAPTVMTAESSYQAYLDDAFYQPLTLSLSEAGLRTFVNRANVIDHIMVNDFLINHHLSGSERVVLPFDLVEAYLATTSDHLPVSTQFDLSPLEFSVDGNRVFEEGSTAEVAVSLNRPLATSKEIRIEFIGSTKALNRLSLPEGNSLLLELEKGKSQFQFDVTIIDDDLINFNDTLLVRFLSKLGNSDLELGEFLFIIEDNDFSEVSFDQDRRVLSEEKLEASVEILFNKTFLTPITLAVKVEPLGSAQLNSFEFDPPVHQLQVELEIPEGLKRFEFSVKALLDQAPGLGDSVLLSFADLPDGFTTGALDEKLIVLDDQRPIALQWEKSSATLSPVATQDTLTISLAHPALLDGQLQLIVYEALDDRIRFGLGHLDNDILSIPIKQGDQLIKVPVELSEQLIQEDQNISIGLAQAGPRLALMGDSSASILIQAIKAMVSFTRDSLMLNRRELTWEIPLSISQNAGPGVLSVSFSEASLTYGNDFIAIPNAENSILSLPIGGSNGLSFSIQLLEDYRPLHDDFIELSLVEVTGNYSLDDPKKLVLFFEESESEEEEPTDENPEEEDEENITSFRNLSNANLLFPNPVTRQLFIKDMDQQLLPFEIFDLQGRSLVKGNYHQEGIDVHDLKPGSYFIRLQSNGEVFLHRFIKQ